MNVLKEWGEGAYRGSALIPELEAEGHRVDRLTRQAAFWRRHSLGP